MDAIQKKLHAKWMDVLQSEVIDHSQLEAFEKDIELFKKSSGLTVKTTAERNHH